MTYGSEKCICIYRITFTTLLLPGDNYQHVFFSMQLIMLGTVTIAYDIANASLY